MGTCRRELPCQPMKIGEDVSDNATLELIKKKMKIQKTPQNMSSHAREQDVCASSHSGNRK